MSKNIEQEINDFVKLFGQKEIIEFMEKCIDILELYDVDEEEDWVVDSVGKDQATNVRIIRTIYTISKIADSFASRFKTLNIMHPQLWRKLEMIGSEKE